MQDHLFFVNASYGVAGIVLGISLAAILVAFFRTKSRLDALQRLTKDAA